MTTAAERDEQRDRWFMAPTDGSGRINSFSLAQLLEQVKRARCRCLILDLRTARVLRIYDVKLLVQTREVLRGRQGRLRVVARAGSEVARLLRQHQLEHFFFVCESLEEAWNGPSGPETTD
jgi:hypothetical protein